MMTVITTALVVCITELDRFYFISKTLFVSNQIKKYFYSSSNIRLPLLNYLRIDDDDISSLQIEIVCRLQPQNYVCRKNMVLFSESFLVQWFPNDWWMCWTGELNWTSKRDGYRKSLSWFERYGDLRFKKMYYFNT